MNAEKKIIVAFRGSYSITNAVVDLSTGRQEYVPYPPSNRSDLEGVYNVRDKDGVRPGQVGYDPRTLYIPAAAWKSFTPFEKQVSDLFMSCFTLLGVLTRIWDSFGRSSRIIMIRFCSSRRASFWSFMKRMRGLDIRSLI